MTRTVVVTLVAVSSIGIAALVIAGERSSAGFLELHRAELADTTSTELVMGLIERDGESQSGKHQHPGGEFGFVISGSIVLHTESGSPQTLEAGESFYQPPGQWHIVSTRTSGAKTVVFRAVKAGEPMVVPVE
jgi:quercetin dioxygenase-like cupin family protein